MIRCPCCKTRTRVQTTSLVDDAPRRTRVCPSCGTRLYTTEHVDRLVNPDEPDDIDILRMQGALSYARYSDDPETQVGCVLSDQDGRVIARGWNHSVFGVEWVASSPTDIDRLPLDRWEKPYKFLHMVHAEEHAICGAAYAGFPLNGATMYTTHRPCATCARMIVNAGIGHLVYGTGETSQAGREWHVTEKILEQGLKSLRRLEDVG